MDNHHTQNTPGTGNEAPKAPLSGDTEQTGEIDFFPCEFDPAAGTYRVLLEVTDGLILFELLSDPGLNATSACWEAIIRDILNKDLPELLPRTTFAQEGDTLSVTFSTKEDQLRFARHIHNVCTDTDLFKLYLENMDKRDLPC